MIRRAVQVATCPIRCCAWALGRAHHWLHRELVLFRINRRERQRRRNLGLK